MTFLIGLVVMLGWQSDWTYYKFHFERAGMAVPVYEFYLGEVQTYTTQGSAEAGGKTMQVLHVSAAMRERIAGLFAATHGLTGCASKAKGIAATGAKTLSFHAAYAADGAECTYDYTESKPVVELTNIFQGMAFTLDEGRKLARLEQYDRLGLDPEIAILYAAVKDGRALELGNISGTLKALAEDPAVLERVRVRAGKLLEASR